MTVVLAIIQAAEEAGVTIMAGPTSTLKKGGRLPSSIKASMKEHKAEILAALVKDKQAKAAGLVVGITGELYTVTISKVSGVHVEHIEGRLEVWYGEKLITWVKQKQLVAK